MLFDRQDVCDLSPKAKSRNRITTILVSIGFVVVIAIMGALIAHHSYWWLLAVWPVSWIIGAKLALNEERVRLNHVFGLFLTGPIYVVDHLAFKLRTGEQVNWDMLN